MNQFLLLTPLLFIGIGLAYAEPIGETVAEVLEFDGYSAIVHLSWNQDKSVSQYEVGCVSCFPNISETTTENSIVLSDLTSIGERPTILLYIIAYDLEGTMINAEQIFIELN